MRRPWRQIITASIMASCFLGTIPNQAWADDPLTLPDFYYYHGDHLGSSSILTGRDGLRVRHYGYTAYGNDLYNNYSASYQQVSHRFTGQILDEETGLYYYNARYYDSEIARFIQADTIVPDSSTSQSLNRYTYCSNNPLKFVDPSGNIDLVTAIILCVTVNVSVAAATGGDIGKAAIAGVIQGACMWAGQDWTTIGRAACAAGGGALGAVATGGDPAMAAVSAGLTFGIVQGLGGASGVNMDVSPDLLSELFFKQLAVTTAAGAGAGGITAEIASGDFADGALGGTIGASAGYVIGNALAKAMPENATDPEIHFEAKVMDYTEEPEPIMSRVDFVSEFKLKAGESYSWKDWASNLAKAFLEGGGHGVQIATNEYSFGLTDRFGLTEGSKYVERYGAWGKASQISAGISRDAALSVASLRGAAWFGKTKAGYALNHNRYIRIGPGNIPKGRPFTYGAGQNVPTLRIGTGKPSVFNHVDLRILGH